MYIEPYADGKTVRGRGPWMSRRAGTKLLDTSIYSVRGGGWRDNIKWMLQAALRFLRTTVLPHIKKHGPQLAEEAAKYALNKASQYAKQKEAPDQVQNLVNQAVNDLPQYVGDVARRIAKDEPRGSGPDAIEIENTVRDLVPALHTLATKRLVPRLNSLVRLSRMNEGMSDMATRYSRMQHDYAGAFKSDDDLEDEMRFMLQLIQALIQSVLAFVYNTGMTRPGHDDVLARLIDGANAAVHQLSLDAAPGLTRSRLALTSSPLDEDDQTVQSVKAVLPAPLNLSPTATQRRRISRSSGKWQNYQVKVRTPPSAVVRKRKPDEKRGGIVGLAAMAIPALAALVPSLISATSDVVHTWTRGSGPGLTVDNVNDFVDALEAAVEPYDADVNRSKIVQIVRDAQSMPFVGRDDYSRYLISQLTNPPSGACTKKRLRRK